MYAYGLGTCMSIPNCRKTNFYAQTPGLTISPQIDTVSRFLTLDRWTKRSPYTKIWLAKRVYVYAYTSVWWRSCAVEWKLCHVLTWNFADLIWKSNHLTQTHFTSLTMLMYPKMSGWSGDLTFVPWEKEQTSLDSVFLVTYIPTGVLLLIVSFLFTPFICLCLLHLYCLFTISSIA